MRTGVLTGGRARAKPRREAGTGTPGQRDGAVGMCTCSEDLDLLLMCRSERGQHDTSLESGERGPGERGRPAEL